MSQERNFKQNNTVSVEMPNYFVLNPNTVVWTERNKIDLAKNINF